MDERKKRLKTLLKNQSGMVDANKIVDSIKGGIISLSELVTEELIPKLLFEKLEDEFILKRVAIESITLDSLLEKRFLSNEKYEQLEERKKEDIRKEAEEKEEAIRIIGVAETGKIIKGIREGNYSNSKIKEFIEENKISEQELIDADVFSKDELNHIMQRRVEEIVIDFGDWSDVPPLLENRLDVFVLGIASSGKSAFMAGLFEYAKSIGKISTEDCHPKGYKYYSKLTSAVRQGKLPPRTPVSYIQHMACTLESKNVNSKTKTTTKHPFTFLEMSGEVFENCLGETKENMPPKFIEHLFSYNKKVFIFAIDYHVHKSEMVLDYDQQDQFVFLLQFLKKNGALDNADALCLLLTKWDKSSDPSPSAATAFLKKNYLSLINTCKDYANELPNLEFKAFPFSLGEFDEREAYKYDPRYSEKIYDFLCDSASYKREEKISWKDKFLK